MYFISYNDIIKAVKLPWIFPVAPFTFNGAHRNILGTLDRNASRVVELQSVNLVREWKIEWMSGTGSDTWWGKNNHTVEPLLKGQECLTKVAELGQFPCTSLYKSCLFYPSWQATSFERPPSWMAFLEGFHCICIIVIKRNRTSRLLTHWCRDKMAATCQTTFSKAFLE